MVDLHVLCSPIFIISVLVMCIFLFQISLTKNVLTVLIFSTHSVWIYLFVCRISMAFFQDLLSTSWLSLSALLGFLIFILKVSNQTQFNLANNICEKSGQKRRLMEVKVSILWVNRLLHILTHFVSISTTYIRD